MSAFHVSSPPAICETRKGMGHSCVIPMPNGSHLRTQPRYNMEDSEAVLNVLFCLFTHFMPKLIQLCSLWGGAGGAGAGGKKERTGEWAAEMEGRGGRARPVLRTVVSWPLAQPRGLSQRL